MVGHAVVAGVRCSRHDPHSGRHVPHGLGPALSRGGAGRTASRSIAFWIDAHAGDQRAVPRLRRGDRLRHLRRDRARSEGLSRRPAAHAEGRRAGLHAAEEAGRSRATGANGGASPSAPPGGGPTAGQLISAGSTTIPSCRSPIATPRPTRAGPARNCRPRPSGSSPRAAGSTAPSSPGATSSRRAASTWPTPGRATSRIENHAGRRLRAHLAGPRLPAQRLRRLRHDRQCLGMDDRLVFAASIRPTRRRPAACRRTRAAAPMEGSYDPRQPTIRIPRKVLKGGSHLLRAELLPPLSPRRAPRRAGRHVDQPCRLPLRGPEERAMSDK